MAAPKHLFGDCVAAGILVVLAGVIAWQSTLWPKAMDVSGDPVVMPRAMAILMIAAALRLALARREPPGRAADAKPTRALAAIAVTVIFGLLLEPFGLIASGILYLLAMQYIAGGRWQVAVPVAVATPVVIWMLFHTALNVPLPVGDIWSGLVN